MNMYLYEYKGIYTKNRIVSYAQFVTCFFHLIQYKLLFTSISLNLRPLSAGLHCAPLHKLPVMYRFAE